MTGRHEGRIIVEVRVHNVSGPRLSEITLDGDVDLAYFEALLATMKLDLASAID